MKEMKIPGHIQIRFIKELQKALEFKVWARGLKRYLESNRPCVSQKSCLHWSSPSVRRLWATPHYKLDLCPCLYSLLDFKKVFTNIRYVHDTEYIRHQGPRYLLHVNSLTTHCISARLVHRYFKGCPGIWINTVCSNQCFKSFE